MTLRSALLTIVLTTVPVLAWAAPGGGIAGSKHDFSAKGGGVGGCTFCHTPHPPPSTPPDNTKHGAGDPNNVGLAGNMAGNHPVAMPFPYNNTASTYNGVTTGSG